MPDTHAGAGCVIGTTMTIEDKIVPNIVGVDIGCDMETVMLKDRYVELQALDKDDGLLYLVVHSGSRHLGKQIAENYQQAAFDALKQNSAEIKELIDTLKNMLF